MIDDQDMAIRQANQPISIEAPTEHERAEIARLNDELRQRPGARCVFTHGVMAMLVEGAKDEGDASAAESSANEHSSPRSPTACRLRVTTLTVNVTSPRSSTMMRRYSGKSTISRLTASACTAAPNHGTRKKQIVS